MWHPSFLGVFFYITLSSPDQTNVTSDTETPNINTERHLEQIKEAGTRRSPIKNDDEKHKETHLFIFKSVQRCEVVMVFSCQMRHFSSPSLPACLSWLFLGLVLTRKSSWGFFSFLFFLENECWLPGSTQEGSHY